MSSSLNPPSARHTWNISIILLSISFQLALMDWLNRLSPLLQVCSRWWGMSIAMSPLEIYIFKLLGLASGYTTWNELRSRHVYTQRRPHSHAVTETKNFFAFKALATHRPAKECHHARIPWKICGPSMHREQRRREQKHLHIFYKENEDCPKRSSRFGSKNSPRRKDCSRKHAHETMSIHYHECLQKKSSIFWVFGKKGSAQ